MRVKLILLNCALLAICLSHLPSTNGEACTAPDTPAGCTDCSDAANAESPDCVTTTAAATEEETTAAAAEGETTTAATGTDTETTTAAGGSSSGCTGKFKRIRKWKRRARYGPKKIRVRRKGGKKGLWSKGGKKNIRVNRNNKKNNKKRGRGGKSKRPRRSAY